MKFDMGTQSLSTLSKQTRGSSDELSQLIKALVDAVTPLQGKFQGQGRAAFDAFKARADQITVDLNRSLSAILGGQAEMDKAFASGDQEQADNARRSEGGANFDAARFGAR